MTAPSSPNSPASPVNPDHPAPPSWTLRAPLPHERMACWMLLPQVDPATLDLQLLVAIDNSTRLIVGAAALGCDTRPPDHERWYVDLHVIPTHRRRGIAKSLLSRIIFLAQLHGISAMDSWGWADSESAAASAWQALGFLPAQHKFEFYGPITGVVEGTRPLHLAALERGRIPPDAKIIPLKLADPLAVAKLHAQHLGGTVARLLPMMDASSPDAFDVNLSTILLIGDRVAGCVLGRGYPAEKMYSCDAVIVDVGIRGGWASAWLRYEAALWALAANYEIVRFHALTQHKDTQHVSRRLSSNLTKTSQSFRRVLTPLPDDAAASAASA